MCFITFCNTSKFVENSVFTEIRKLTYSGQFTLSTQLMKPNYLVSLPTDAAPQKLTPCITIKSPL